MIVTFSRFDLRNLATTGPQRVLIPLAMVVALGATLPVSGLSIPIGALIASLTVSYPFQADERGLLDSLYATTPVSRRAVVIGRYVSALVLGAVAIGVGAATTIIGSALERQSIDWPLLALMLLIAFGVLAVALAVQLPFFFALGYTRARPLIYIPVAVISVLGFIAGQTGLLDGTTTLGTATSPSPAAALIVLPLGAVLLVGSASIAIQRYQRREL